MHVFVQHDALSAVEFVECNSGCVIVVGKGVDVWELCVIKERWTKDDAGGSTEPIPLLDACISWALRNHGLSLHCSPMEDIRTSWSAVNFVLNIPAKGFPIAIFDMIICIADESKSRYVPAVRIVPKVVCYDRE